MVSSKMCIFPSDNFPKVRLGPLRRRMLKWETERYGWIGLWGPALRSGWVRGIGLWLDQAGDRAQLLEQDGDRVLHIGQAGYVASGKIAQLGKYLWVSCCYSLHYIKLLLNKK